MLGNSHFLNGQGPAMILRHNQPHSADGDNRPKWFNSPITFHEGPLTEIRAHLPAFERRGFGYTNLAASRPR